MSLPRPEYPRPNFMRQEWLCLNGEWEFDIDNGDSGLERRLHTSPLKGRIIVPFCPESGLSGVGYTDFMPAVWYRRTVHIPEQWHGCRILLHFQAVDYDATVWVNGIEAGRHRGGFTPFTCDLKGIVRPGEDAAIVVRARDYRDASMPRGKQSRQYSNYSCLYTRTTGIWQSVWMEPVPEVYLQRPRITPDVANRRFRLEAPVSNNRRGYRLRAVLRDARGDITQAEAPADLDFTPQLDLTIPESRLQLWEPGNPFLYDLAIELVDANGNIIDQASSYAGLRSVTREGQKILINGKPIFQRLVLDQGYYPDGILTASSDEALVCDIELSMAAGFNGARLHQKVFEERFLYHADRAGYLVWSEFPDWGSQGFGPEHDHQSMPATFITQWLEAIERDYSHPSIIGWCPLNETWQVLTDRITGLDDAMRGMFLAVKALDTTRPVLDTSGYSHRVPETDIYDSHDYEQVVLKFAQNHSGTRFGLPFHNRQGTKTLSIPYHGQPYMVSEFGGTWWNPQATSGANSWGYGNSPKDIEEFYTRFEGLCGVLLDDPSMFAYCYTQLTDVYQEQNGIYTFDRIPKFDLKRLRAIQTRQAAIEKLIPGAGEARKPGQVKNP
ncbi:MAG: glycoside hydrolase family 2 protein [Omnitrophica WOR_2 bacterium]